MPKNKEYGFSKSDLAPLRKGAKKVLKEVKEASL